MEGMDDDAMDDDEAADGKQKHEQKDRQKDTITEHDKKGDGEGEEDPPLTLHRVISNCMAFLGVIFIVSCSSFLHVCSALCLLNAFFDVPQFQD